MHRGYVKLWRKIEDWAWYRSSETFHVFCHLLMKSNHKDSTFMGFPVPRGSCVIGRNALASALGITERQVRTAITRLKTTNELTIKTTNRFSIVSIVNYEEYQDKTTSKESNEVTLKRPTNDQQTTTSKECNNVKNEKNKDSNGRFTPPTQEEASAYFKSIGCPFEATNFYEFYASKGWVVGRAPMKNWRMAANRWAKNTNQFKQKGGKDESVQDHFRRLIRESEVKTAG